MAISLSNLCTRRLCQTDYKSSLPQTWASPPSFPFPSIVEEILVHDDNLKLPGPLADSLMEGLSQTGKLTEKALFLLMNPDRRANLTSLRLPSTSINDKSKFRSLLRQQKHLTRLDASFGVGDLFKPNLPVALHDTCKSTLVSLSVSHVTKLNVSALTTFSSLERLDVDYTSASGGEIANICASLNHLTRLDVSHTEASWYQVFCSATSLVNLTLLGMRELVFLAAEEYRDISAVKSTQWVVDFFASVTRLSSLDISSVKNAKREMAEYFAACHRAILQHAVSLTHLNTYCTGDSSLAVLTQQLIEHNRLHQLDVLICNRNDEAIPSALTSNANLAVLFDGMRPSCINVCPERLLSEEFIRSGSLHARLAYLYVKELTEEELHCHLPKALSAAVVMTSRKRYKVGLEFLARLLSLRGGTRNWYNMYCRDSSIRIDVDDVRLRELWYRLLENCLRAFARDPACGRQPKFAYTLCDALRAASSHVQSRPLLLHAAVDFVLSLLTKRDFGVKCNLSPVYSLFPPGSDEVVLMTRRFFDNFENDVDELRRFGDRWIWRLVDWYSPFEAIPHVVGMQSPAVQARRNFSRSRIVAISSYLCAETSFLFRVFARLLDCDGEAVANDAAFEDVAKFVGSSLIVHQLVLVLRHFSPYPAVDWEEALLLLLPVLLLRKKSRSELVSTHLLEFFLSANSDDLFKKLLLFPSACLLLALCDYTEWPSEMISTSEFASRVIPDELRGAVSLRVTGAAGSAEFTFK